MKKLSGCLPLPYCLWDLSTHFPVQSIIFIISEYKDKTYVRIYNKSVWK